MLPYQRCNLEPDNEQYICSVNEGNFSKLLLYLCIQSNEFTNPLNFLIEWQTKHLTVTQEYMINLLAPQTRMLRKSSLFETID